MSTLLDSLPQIITVALAVVGGASLMVAAIAPLTENKKDDEVASWLKKVHTFLSKVAVNPKP